MAQARCYGPVRLVLEQPGYNFPNVRTTLLTVICFFLVLCE